MFAPLALLLAASSAGGALPAPGTYTLDPPHTFVVFSAQHRVVGLVRGRFDKTAGTVVVARNPADCSVDVSIDAASLSTQRDKETSDPAVTCATQIPGF